MLSAAKETGSCPMAGLLETLARPWTMHILWALSTGGPTRFGALRRKIGGIRRASSRRGYGILKRKDLFLDGIRRRFRRRSPMA
jgi:hypothetical protein